MGPDPQETVYLVTFTEEILNGKLHFLWSEIDVLARKKRLSKLGFFIKCVAID